MTLSAAPSAPSSAARTLRQPATLELRELSKSYGGLRAVDRVSLTAHPGEVLGIAGPNGAGKTTLFDIVTGLTAPSGGDIRLGGASLLGATVHHRCRLGMARTFQQPTVGDELTTWENIVVAARFGRPGTRWSGLGDGPDENAAWIIEWSGLAERSETPARLLGVYEKKCLMLATAFATGPLVLLLDEPFGGLTPDEIDQTLALVRSVADFGVTVVCIEHVMRALVQLANRIVVMHHGQTFFEGTPDEMVKDRRVVEIYLGGAYGRGGAAAATPPPGGPRG